MKKTKKFLRNREDGKKEDIRLEDCVPEECWYSMMPEYDRINLTSMVLIGPGVFILFFHYITGIILNIPLTYLIMDIFTVMCKRHFAIRRLKMLQEIARQGDRTDILRQKVEELKEIEQKKREEQRARQKED